MSSGRFDKRMMARWTGTFIGFPLAGLAAKAVAGPIDGNAAALAGGLAGGVVLGAVQSIALRSSSAVRIRWAIATAVGMSAGLAVGAGLVDHATDTGSLVAMGAVTGIGVGLAQAAVMSAPVWRRLTWTLLTPALWALGWLITSQVINDVDAQYANFGASGALVCAAVSGAVLAIGAHAVPVATMSTVGHRLGAVR